MDGKAPISVPRTIVLVGLMGAGKTCIGRELAERLGLPFADADTEIEAAAGCPIEDIFSIYGETEFRNGEKRVLQRLLGGPIHVLATGGGAFMNQETREHIKRSAISVWLRADLDLLVSRVARRQDRPLLKNGDPEEILRDLIAQRYPIYVEADITVDSGRESPSETVERVLGALRAHLEAEPAKAPSH